jgi:hypothetical protein
MVKLLYESCVAAFTPPCSAIPEYQVLPEEQFMSAAHVASAQVMVQPPGSGSPLGQTFAEKEHSLAGPVCTFTMYHLLPITCTVSTDKGQVHVTPLTHFWKPMFPLEFVPIKLSIESTSAYAFDSAPLLSFLIMTMPSAPS